MKTQVINNKEAIVNSHYLPDPKAKASTGYHGELISLIPGMNLVDSKKLLGLRKQNPLFDSFFRMKIAPSLAPEQNPEKVGHCILVQGIEVEDSSPLQKLKPAEAISMVEETFSPEHLAVWQDEETRGDVRRAIAEQLRKLETPTPATGPRTAE